MADCAANPNDPICMAYYGTSPDAGQIVKTYTTNQQTILAALAQGPLTYGQATLPGSTVNTFTAPGQSVVVGLPITSPWYTTWWGIGLLALGAGVGYFKIIKPRLNKAA